MKHERRVVGHASGWKEQMNTCVCGKPWPCSELEQPSSKQGCCCPCHRSDKPLPPLIPIDGKAELGVVYRGTDSWGTGGKRRPRR